MNDVFSKEKRSDVMSRIRGSGNRDTELALMRIFREQKITGWRRHQRVFGKPDFVFLHDRLCVFVDGCFWHGCPKCYRAPGSNKPFWRKKFEVNLARDRRVNRELRKAGWGVLRIWEHQLTVKTRTRLVRRLIDGLAKGARRRSAGGR